MKLYVIQSKNGIMINVSKKLDNWGSSKNDYVLNPIMSETSLNDKKVTYEKKQSLYSHNFIGKYILAIINCHF